MSDDMLPVLPEDPMNFNCCSDNECFNECCRDLNQALTPYDILRMKTQLNITSQEFIRSFTSLHHGPESGLPILTFKPNPQTGHACPFVTAKGCLVYENRPGSCRLYPMARAIARSRESGEIEEFYARIQEPHCKGGCHTPDLTVAQWLKGQDVELYNYWNDKLMTLISLKNRIVPGKLDGVMSDRFYLALYDLDEFREKIFNQDLLGALKISAGLLDTIKQNDEALLDFGFRWVGHMLFGQPLEEEF